MLPTGRFTRKEHIKRPAEIRNLFKDGKKISISGAKLFFAPNNMNMNRIAFSLSRGYGNAILRNKSKRYSREVYRSIKTCLNNGYDMVFLVYPGNNTFSTRYVQFCSLCEKAGLLKH